MANGVVQFLRLPVLASSGLAVIASSVLYFKQKYLLHFPWLLPVVSEKNLKEKKKANLHLVNLSTLATSP